MSDAVELTQEDLERVTSAIGHVVGKIEFNAAQRLEMLSMAMDFHFDFEAKQYTGSREDVVNTAETFLRFLRGESDEAEVIPLRSV